MKNEINNIDFYILYNEDEENIEEFVRKIDELGFTTFFLRRDAEKGKDWGEIEINYLRLSTTILAFIGDRGWGPYQLMRAEQAKQYKKTVIPVRIGMPPETSYFDARHIFGDLRYFYLPKPDPDSVKSFLDSIVQNQPPVNTRQFDQMINTIIEGHNEERISLLTQIMNSKELDRQAFSFRLRKEIQNLLNEGKFDDFVNDEYDLKKNNTIWSWMISCLIYTNAEDEENKKVLLYHLSLETEPNTERNIRYWVLSGLYKKNVSYLNEAVDISLKDPYSYISNLAKAIKSPNEYNLIPEFRYKLNKEDFSDNWEVLRILRIVAIPELAADVCRKLVTITDNTPVVYDVLYALANPGMAKAAATILETMPGPESLVNRIIGVSRDSDQNAIRNFSYILTPFDARVIEPVFEKVRRNPETREIADKIRGYLFEYRENEGVARFSIAGYCSDTINVEHDWLGIGEDVKTLTSIMIAKDVHPPLAVGLFGDWGSGKSFFMKSIQSEINKLIVNNSNNPNSRIHSNIVSIEFNAWHYIDTNLLASLVSTIFESLAAYVSPKKTPEEQQKIFLSELESAKKVERDALDEKTIAEKLVSDKQKELKDLQTKREESEIELSELQYQDLITLLGDEKEDLDNALNDMGIPAVLNSISDLNNVVSDIYTVKGRMTALFLSIINGKNKHLVIGLLILLLGIPIVIWVLYNYFNLSPFITKVSTYSAEIVTVISSVAIVLKRGLGKMKMSITVIEKKKKRIDELLAQKRKNPSPEEIVLQEKVQELKEKEEKAFSKVTAAAAKVIEIEERIQILKEERNLSRFLYERIQSDDYRKHLGLIDTIRKDFVALTSRLKDAENTAGNHFKPVDRIILYIDDLDRCPAEKVIEVLQAVHLLLAFPLFVVVVGVDPRWLLHSLDKTYPAFRNELNSIDENQIIWRTTPQNFIEKIFQIPFTLRKMTDRGFDKMIGELFNQPAVAKSAKNVVQTENTMYDQKSAHTQEGFEHSGSGLSRANIPLTGQVDQQSSGDAKGGQSEEQPVPPVFKIYEASLELQAWESWFAGDLFAFIPTPRAAKRFSNIYRILKASVRQKDLADFEGTAERPGNFQVPMLLLSILTGTPSDAVKLFPDLMLEAPKSISIKEAFKNVNENPAISTTLPKLNKNINQIVELETFPQKVDLLTEWIPRVSRFSFELGRMAQPVTDFLANDLPEDAKKPQDLVKKKTKK